MSFDLSLLARDNIVPDAAALLDHEFLSSNCACHFLIGKLQRWEDTLQMNVRGREKVFKKHHQRVRMQKLTLMNVAEGGNGVDRMCVCLPPSRKVRGSNPSVP